MYRVTFTHRLTGKSFNIDSYSLTHAFGWWAFGFENNQRVVLTVK